MSKKQQSEAATMFSTPGDEPQEQPTQKPKPAKPAPQQEVSLVSDIEAEAIVGNSECVFTDGCRGRIYAYNTVRVTVKDGDTERIETRQQLRCNSCGRIAKGYRVVGMPGNRKLFDRHTKR